MQNLQAHHRRSARRNDNRRKGSIIALSAFVLVLIFAFLSFTVDVGYILVTKGRMQNACDAGVMAAALELPDGLGVAPKNTPLQQRAACGTAAKQVAGVHEAGGMSSVYVDETRDLRYGQVVWDPIAGEWKKTWDVVPYNLVKLNVRRDGLVGAQDGPLNLFFAPVIGHSEATLVVESTSAMLPAMGFRVVDGQPSAGVLPITLDEPTWNDLIEHNIGTDNYSYDETTGAITNGPDGVLEVDLYPYGNDQLPPGNRGTVDFGHTGNSANDLKRQILYGLNADDLSYFPNNDISASYAFPLILNGDTGISAGIKAQLEQIKGLPRAIPIFTNVSGNGNNANYTIVKYVGIRIVNVKLTGNPKRVVVQPAPLFDPTAVPDNTGGVTVEDGVFTKPVLLQ